MEDTCNPKPSLQINAFRIWSIIIPTMLFILMVECLFVFSMIPDSIGNALTLTGKLPALPPLDST
jgi:hypothetical protein